MFGTIKELYIYPVKSCAGLRLEEATLTAYGLEGDRQWMIVDSQGKMLTQRANPKLALIQPRLSADGLNLSYPMALSIDVNVSELRQHKAVTIWRDSVTALVASEQVNTWITEVLDSTVPLFLVKFEPKHIRQPGSVARFGETARHFADAAPILVANSASLDALNQALSLQQKTTIDIRRFRPNIVVDGIPAFVEHDLSHFTFDNKDRIDCIDHCERCIVISIDQSTAIKHPTMVPFNELVALNPMPEKPKPAFGVNAVLNPQHDAIEIQVDDSIDYYFL